MCILEGVVMVKYFPADPLQAVHPVCAHELLQAILVILVLAQLGQYAV